MKFGRYEFDINENDLILDNGSCYQLVTREVGTGWNKNTPRIAKSTFDKLRKIGTVYTNDELKQLANKKYGHCTYWKFNIELIDKL